MENSFLKAVRRKLRFVTGRGSLTVEQLWDLSLTSLDELAKGVNRQLKALGEESFLPGAKNKAGNSDLELQLDILKTVINTKVAEEEASRNRAAKRAQLATLKELAANKAADALSGKSLDEINNMIAQLENEGA